MRYKLSIILVCLFGLSSYCQDLFIGIGFEVNQTRFRQKAPTVEVEFSNPHKADIGISAYSSLSLKIKKKFLMRVKPELAILKTKSEVTSSNKISFVNASLELGYFITEKVQLEAGLEYSYLIKRISTFNGQSADFTFFRNHRYFLSPTFGVAYDIDNNWSAHFRCVYFLQDLFNSGALDNDGNIVGPVMVYPYTIGIGCTYSFQIMKSK